MRVVATAILLSMLATTARADDTAYVWSRDAPEHTPSRYALDDMTALEAATAPCAVKSPISGAASSCARVDGAKLAGIGAVSVYRYGALDNDIEGIGYRLTFEHAGQTWISNLHHFLVHDCYSHGLCTSAVRVTETLRAIELAGKPAAALEIHVRRRHTNNGPHYDYSIDATVFMICGVASSDALRCTAFEVADECHPALNAHGTVSYQCPTDVALSLDHP